MKTPSQTTAKSSKTKEFSSLTPELRAKALQTLHILEHTIAPDLEKPNFTLVRTVFLKLLEERTNRAKEVQSSEVKKAIELARAFFLHMNIRVMMCMDRRTKPTLAYALPGQFAGSVRVAGGAPTGFVRNEHGGLMLDPTAAFTTQLRETLTSLENLPIEQRVLIEIIDSHIHCAAQNLEAQTTGKNVLDSGHLGDVSFKGSMGETLKEFTKTYYPHTTLLPIQTSFNPENGFMFMGASKKECQDYAKAHGGYTEEVFEHLVKTGQILSTAEIVKNPKVRELFEKHAFVLNWSKAYKDAALHFWTHMTELEKDGFPLIAKYIQQVYPHLSPSETEFIIRTKLVLVNTYSGFLHNWKKHYEFHDHTESVVVVVNGGGYGPFSTITALEVAENEEGVLAGVGLASSIIRSNRKEGRSEGDPSLPVPVVIKVRARLTAEEEKVLSDIELSDLPQTDWIGMTDRQFYDYLEMKWKKGSPLPLRAARALNELRLVTAKFYDRKEKLSKQFVEKSLVGIPIVIGNYRNVLGIYPFTIAGYR